jgi:hypothetical protein
MQYEYLASKLQYHLKTKQLVLKSNIRIATKFNCISSASTNIEEKQKKTNHKPSN